MNYSAIVVAVVVPVVLRHVMKAVPISEDPDDYPPYEELDQRWGNIYLAIGVAVIPAMALFGVISWYVLAWLAHMALPDPDSGIIVYRASDFMQMFPALFLGIMLVAPVGIFLEKILLKPQALKEFIYYQKRRAGGDDRKALGRMAVFVVPLSLLFSVFLADTYTVFREDRIVDSGFFALGETEYRYENITTIERQLTVEKNTRTGKIKDSYFSTRIRFGDDGDWYNVDTRGMLDSDPEKGGALLAFLEKKTGISHVRFPDIVLSTSD
ncbi:MAG: hypothetical protein OEZ10_00880 [Gammaproteobacteria bacterium]|nr:hypothetical protein [Gammaproteobacteria bacterium]